MIRAVGLDLDNTLYDHAQYVRGAYRQIGEAVAAATGIAAEVFTARIFADWQRLTSRCNHIFRDALRDHGIHSDALEMQLVELYREHLPVLSAYPGIKPALAKLRNAGLKLAVLSDGHDHIQRRKLAALALEGEFDSIIITGTWGAHAYKPAPIGFQALSEQLGVEPRQLAYVGDNPLVDFLVPKQLGMTTLRVRSAEFAHLPNPPNAVDREFTDTASALAWLYKSSTANNRK